MKSAVVKEDYSVVYTNPTILKKGETVRIEKWETNLDWIGAGLNHLI